MAGHSKYKNTMHRKGAQDKKKANAFNKIIRAITSAVNNGGPDIKFNFKLESALQAARDLNMSKDTIENAIKKASSNVIKENYEEIRYEGYGPLNIAFIIEALTDNRNRTGGDIRTAFSKNGGNLAESGAVNYLFMHLCVITYNITNIDEEMIFETAIEFQADECNIICSEHETKTKENDIKENNLKECEIVCNIEKYGKLKIALEEKYGKSTNTKIIWKPINIINLNEEDSDRLLRFINILEDNEDVQSVWCNANI